jgi:hypothetical protein
MAIEKKTSKMGCDIHILIEFYDIKKKRWVLVDGERYEPVKIKSLKAQANETDEEYEERIEQFEDNIPDLNVDRNYDLFAYLANVRNNGTIVPLSFPKKSPKDISKDAKRIYNHFGDHLHSRTWFTTVELLCFDLLKYGGEDLLEMVQEAHNKCTLSRFLISFDN